LGSIQDYNLIRIADLIEFSDYRIANIYEDHQI